MAAEIKKRKGAATNFFRAAFNSGTGRYRCRTSHPVSDQAIHVVGKAVTLGNYVVDNLLRCCDNRVIKNLITEKVIRVVVRVVDTQNLFTRNGFVNQRQ